MKDFISKETAVDSEILKFNIKQVHYHHKIITKPSVGFLVCGITVEGLGVVSVVSVGSGGFCRCCKNVSLRTG